MLGMSKGRIALGLLSIVGAVGGLYLDARESEESRKEQKEAAYQAGCEVAKEFYEKKGNPNAKRNKGRKSS